MNFLGTTFRLHNKKLLAAFMLVLALALAACGGGAAEEPGPQKNQ